MIALTRRDGSPVIVNADSVLMIDRTPDTLITLVNGEKLAVQEPVDEVVRLAIAYQRRLRFADMSARISKE